MKASNEYTILKPQTLKNSTKRLLKPAIILLQASGIDHSTDPCSILANNSYPSKRCFMVFLVFTGKQTT
jgi:hypothetical protein